MKKQNMDGRQKEGGDRKGVREAGRKMEGEGGWMDGEMDR